ncbi:hypothetical protein BJV74DRAFT_854616 [Russula compacta]|nr:hypothetical protein BJV74DRAFT_854616 [Russula compacta]
MDIAKDSGSAAIDLTDRSRTRLYTAFSTMAKRAREDPGYRRSLDALFNLAQKWLKATEDVAVAAAQSVSLESLVNDPTPEKHLIRAIRYINQLLQNIAGGKNLNDLYSALRTCTVDIRNDSDLQQWFEDYFAYARRMLENVGDNDPEEIRNTSEDLSQRWDVLIDTDSDKNSRWKEDLGILRKEAREFQERMEQDKDLQAVRKAHAQFGRDVEEILIDVAAVGLQAAISGTSWLWTDLFNVYLPRFISMLKSVPIPRTEYVDEKIEFVLEDLDISSIALLPGHVFIRNITDIEIAASSDGKSTTAVGALTNVHVKGVQLRLNQLSFYYHDLTASVGPAEFTGLAEITLPPEGVDVRAERQRFLRVDEVQVNVSDDVDLRVTHSNHPVLLTVFRPLLTARLRAALQKTLSASIQNALDGADALAWDTLVRAEVELGRLRRTQGGLFLGWHTTGTGIVRNGGKVEVALGAEPQVLGAEKHGPKGTLAQPLKERAREGGVGMDVDVSVERVEGAVKDGVGRARDGIKAGLRKVRTFEENSGWESSAFNV